MSGTQEFERLAEAYFEATYQAMPVMATLLGVHKYDDRLGDFDRASLDADLARTKHFLSQIRQIDAGGLEGQAAHDRVLLENEMLTSIQWHEKLVEWRRNPNFYVEWPLYGVFILATREFAPLPDRLASILGRLRALGPVLRTATQNLDNPPRVFTEVAIETAEGGVQLLQEMVPAIAAKVPKMESEVLAANGGAITALSNYLDFLKSDLLPRSGGNFAVGREVFAERLRHEHMLDLSIEEVAAVGRRAFDETRRALEELAHEIDPSKTWPELIAETRQQHPGSHELLDAYHRELAALRAFVADRDLVTIPPNEHLELVETPSFERSTTPYAAYMPPAPMEATQKGEFWVTPIDTTQPPEQQRAQLEEHCYVSIPATALHEAYPGHHLQLVYSNNVSNYVRKHVSSNLFAEGWALYCEQLVGEQGYVPVVSSQGNGGARVLRLFLLKDQLWRAARVLIDVGLHVQGMSIEDATRLLVDEVKLSAGAARTEVRRYAMTATQPLSYMLGKLEILRLRDEFKDLPLRQFHDLLLSSGTIPLKIVGQEMRNRTANGGVL